MMTIRHIALAAFFALAWSVGLAAAQALADQQAEVRPAVARPVLGSPFLTTTTRSSRAIGG